MASPPFPGFGMREGTEKAACAALIRSKNDGGKPA